MCYFNQKPAAILVKAKTCQFSSTFSISISYDSPFKSIFYFPRVLNILGSLYPEVFLRWGTRNFSKFKGFSQNSDFLLTYLYESLATSYKCLCAYLTLQYCFSIAVYMSSHYSFMIALSNLFFTTNSDSADCCGSMTFWCGSGSADTCL